MRTRASPASGTAREVTIILHKRRRSFRVGVPYVLCPNLRRTPGLALGRGPVGRSVRDVALMLGAIFGQDPLSPVTIAEPGRVSENSTLQPSR